MFLFKLRLASVVLTALGIAGLGTLVVSPPALAGKSDAAPSAARASGAPAEEKKDADKKDDDKIDETAHAAARVTSANNLKLIGLAFHNCLTNNDKFPAHAIYSKDGKPLLSWRVAILPYLEQDALYKEFKLDEPWDSDNNKKLLAKMPKTYAVPGKKDTDKTYYQTFYGKGAVLEGKDGFGIGGYPDGTSNIILAVEAGESVPWTKPADVDFNPDKPLPKLGGLFKGGMNVLMLDGSTRWIKKDYDEKKLREYIFRNSGQVRPDLP